MNLSLVHPAFAASKTTWSGNCVMSNGEIATIQGFECLFYNVMQVVVYLAGLVFLFMFITGGFKYMFASGDPKKIASASSTLTLSLLGLVGVIVSVLILRLIENLTGVNVTQFAVPQ